MRMRSVECSTKSGVLTPSSCHRQDCLCSLMVILFQPTFRQFFSPSEKLAKIETTTHKIGAYLEKADAESWWKSWLGEAQNYANPADVEAQLLEGVCGWVGEE